MLDDRAVSKSVRELAKRVAETDDPAMLCELVVEINKLLDAIETQAEKLEGLRRPVSQ
jgi:hypothetical protein